MLRRLLFVTLAGYGHVTPTLPLVEELLRRGHRVDYAIGAEHGAAVANAGADWPSNWTSQQCGASPTWPRTKSTHWMNG
jgi:UDP:flavonoid glycosyltransferase YjiC (YdhE family)